MSRVSSSHPAALAAAAEPVANSGMLLRKCSCGGTCDECKEDESVHRKAAATARSAEAPAIVHDVIRTSGEAIDARTRTDMERRMGHDFSRVRIHTDARAAASARAVDAHAYTVGHHVVFGSGRFAPSTSEGRHLLAHELAHTVQQRATAARRQNRLVLRGTHTAEERAADRAADAAVRHDPASPLPAAQPGVLQRKATSPCDGDHAKTIATATAAAEHWLGSVSRWFTAHLELIKKRTPKGGTFKSVGPALFAQLVLLDRHFNYGEVVRKSWRSGFPDSAGWEGSFKDFETLARASFDIRNKFSSVKVSGLGVSCEKPCPSGEEGAEVVGSARAGSGAYTIYTDCFDRQGGQSQAGVVLHEAFHASFDKFSGDSYEHQKGYPGTDAVNNADSYANFASIVATGNPFRVVVIPVEIKAGENGATP